MGVNVNIMDEHQFKEFPHRTGDKPTLETRKIPLRTFQR